MEDQLDAIARSLVGKDENDISSERILGDYEIRLYDDVVLSFTFIQKGIVRELGITNIKVYSQVLPFGLSLTEDGVLDWMRRRVIPKNREFVRTILRSLNLSLNDIKGILDVCLGLSVNDSYWVTRAGFEGKFDNYNLYDNAFSEVLSLVAYTGIYQEHGPLTISPELTTGGMLPKAWRRVNNTIYLYKGGTSGAANTGLEPYSEFYAFQIARRMGITVVEYGIEKWKGILASYCKLFTDKYTSFVPVGTVVTSGGLNACIEYYRSLHAEFVDVLYDMIVFDSVICNTDRHCGNFGLLVDSYTNKIIKPAPVFDNGLSLLCYAMQSDFEDINEYIIRLGPANSGMEFIELARTICTSRQKAALRNLIGFQFERHPKYNLPEWRLKALESIVQQRVRDILK